MEEATGMHGTAPLRRSQAKLAGDLNDLVLPDGRRVAEINGGELMREFSRLGVPHIRAGDGKEILVAAYKRHLEAIADEAGRVAVADYLRSMR